MQSMQRLVGRRRRRAQRSIAVSLACSVLLLVNSSTLTPAVAAHAQQTTTPATWPTYLFGATRSGFNASETTITPASAPHLKLHWKLHIASAISAQPISDNNLIYWGSWDGFEHATSLTGAPVWATNLGQSSATCTTLHGVTSTATTFAVNGRPTLLVGGGNKRMYALDALTGAVIWQRSLGNYIWSSPLVANGSVYSGTASLGDCPNIHGQFLQLNATTGVIQHTFDVVPTGCTGGSVWGSPTLDPAANMIYIATGNLGTCAKPELYPEAIVQLDASTLIPVASWQIPAAQRASDGDFGSTPTLFQATIAGSTHTLVGVANKNGFYYAFDTAAIAHGPLWQDKIAIGGASPERGQGSISPSAWDGATLYVAGGNTTINSVSCKGSVRALDPATGAYLWQDCLSSFVLAAVSVVPGVAAVDVGTALMLVATASGAKLFTFKDTTSGSRFWGPASLIGGIIYQGNMDGALFAIGT